MKKNLFYLFAAAFMLGVTGCKDPGSDPDPATLDITYEGEVNNNLTIGDIPAAGETYTISVTSNRDWEFVEVEDDIFIGLSVSPKSCTKNQTVTVTITVPANVVGDLPIPDDDGNARSKELEFRTIAEGEETALTRTVTISQLAADNGGDDPEVLILESARFDNFKNAYGSDRGVYVLMFQYQNEGGFTQEVRFELVSEYNEDILRMDLAKGEYSYATTHAKGTMTERASVLLEPYKLGGSEIVITGGQATIGDDLVEMSLELENGETMTAKYEGPIYPSIYPDVAENVANLTDWDEVSFFEGGEGVWKITMKNTDNNTSVNLMVNTEAGLEDLPVGNFSMASTPRAGVAGTAEPASMMFTSNNLHSYDWGCWYWGDYDWTWDIYYGSVVQYAVPGEGSIDISKEGNIYTVNFTFAGPDGKTVSGSCQKEVEVVDPNAFYLDFTSAKNEGYSDINPMIEFYWDGAANGEKLLLDMYVQANPPQMIPDGTYNFIDDYNVTGTFSGYGGLTVGSGQDQRTKSPDGGNVKFTKVGDNYKVEFNVHFDDGRTLKCTYEGPITED